MRWNNLSVAAPESPGALPLAIPGSVARTFDTPGFAGMTFYEIQAKSIISRVPVGLAGAVRVDDQPLSRLLPRLLLLPGWRHPDPDGRRQRQRPLADIRVGDAVYGTVRIAGLPAIRADHRARTLVDN